MNNRFLIKMDLEELRINTSKYFVDDNNSFDTLARRPGHWTPSVLVQHDRILQVRKFSRGLYFRETSDAKFRENKTLAK